MQTRRAKLMAALILDNGKYYVRAFFSVMVALSIALLTPLVMAETIDAIIGTRPLNAPDFVVRAFEAIGGRDYVANNLWIVALLLLVLSVIRSTFMYIRGRSAAQASERAVLDLRQRLYSHLQRLTYNYHVKAETGDLIQRCTSDVETTRRFLAMQLVEATNAFLTVTVSVAVMMSHRGHHPAVPVCVPVFQKGYQVFPHLRRGGGQNERGFAGKPDRCAGGARVWTPAL